MAFIGILSVIIVAVPAFLYAVVEGTIGSGEWYALAAIVLLKFALFFAYRSIMKKGVFYTMLVRLVPTTEVFMNDLQNNRIDKRQFIYTVFTSVCIEFIGHCPPLCGLCWALNFTPSLLAAMLGYIISVIFLIVSPFLRGLGAIEVSMTYVLLRFGFGNVDAIAITFLYRFFEFWSPLLVGILAFLSKLNKLLMRVFPAFFLLALGIINIISVLTPAISERVEFLKDFLPVQGHSRLKLPGAYCRLAVAGNRRIFTERTANSLVHCHVFKFGFIGWTHDQSNRFLKRRFLPFWPL